MDSKCAGSQSLADLSLVPIACIRFDLNWLQPRALGLFGNRLPADILHGAQFPWNLF